MGEKETVIASRSEMYKSFDNASVLQIRLNSDYILQRVRTYLTGQIEIVTYDNDGNPIVERKKIAVPKANNEGIQAILNYVENVINPQTVQGNLTETQYDNYVAEIHSGLLENCMDNLYNWEIDEDNYNHLIDSIMVLVIPFISRLINNKERDSYGGFQVRETDTHVNRDKIGLFNKNN